MQLNSSDFKVLCDVAIVAAQKAGEFISTYTRKNIKVNSKTAGSTMASQVVTEVDIKSQEIILKELEATRVKYDLALLIEESDDDKSRFDKDYFWCIDPLDGTLPFTQNKPGYSVSIALVRKDGVPQIGVVYDPIENNLYSATHQQGAFKNHQPWTLNSSSNILSFVPASTLKTHFTQKKITKSIKKKLFTDGISKTKPTKIGGAVMNAIWLLENAPAFYIKFPKAKAGGGSLWDYAATACICAELGACVSDVFGHKLNLNQAESTFLNAKGVVYASDKNLHNLLVNELANFDLNLANK